MEAILYPVSFTPIAEDEMTYISGGAGNSSGDDFGGTVLALGLALGVIGIAYAIRGGNDNRLRKEYTEATGLSPVDEQGRVTSDFKNYKERSYSQGRDKQTGSSVSLINALPALAIGGATILVLALSNS